MSHLQDDLKKWAECNPIASGTKISVDSAYAIYVKWASGSGMFVRNKTAFGLALRAIFPDILRVRIMENGDRTWYYIFPGDEFDDIL